VPLIPTKYDNRITNLRERIDKPGQQRGAQKRLNRLQGRRELYQDRNRPPTPLPFNAEYESTVGRLNRDKANTQADIAGQRLATESQFGFGNDTSNPFSQARLLERQYQQRRSGTTNSYAGAGQLYSGALSNQRNADSFAGQQSLDTALREYQTRLADLNAGELKSQTGYDDSLAAAEAKRLEAALQEPVDPSEAPPRGSDAKHLLDRLKKNAKRQTKQGHKNKADALRERIDRLKDKP
jgi:hypothetical protein